MTERNDDQDTTKALLEAVAMTIRDSLDLRGIELTWSDVRPAAAAAVDVVRAALDDDLDKYLREERSGLLARIHELEGNR